MAALSFYPIHLPMKTLYPIILSFSLLIPFSPVGEYLWQHGQQGASSLAVETRNNGQGWWHEAIASQEQLVQWFQRSKQQGWQQIDAGVLSVQQELQQQGDAIQTGLSSGQDALQQTWQHGQQSLQQWTRHLWQESVQFSSDLVTSVQALPATVWPDDPDTELDPDAEAIGSLSLAANTPPATEP